MTDPKPPLPLSRLDLGWYRTFTRRGHPKWVGTRGDTGKTRYHKSRPGGGPQSADAAVPRPGALAARLRTLSREDILSLAATILGRRRAFDPAGGVRARLQELIDRNIAEGAGT